MGTIDQDLSDNQAADVDQVDPVATLPYTGFDGAVLMVVTVWLLLLGLLLRWISRKL